MAESLARKSLFTTLINLLGAVIAYAGIFVISRYMSTAEFTIGLIGFTVSYVGLFLPVSKLGFSTAHIKKVSEGADIGQCNGAMMLITLALTGLMSLLVFASILVWVILLHHGFETPLELQGIWIMLLYTVITVITSVPMATFSARREVAKAQIGTFVGHIVRVAAIVFVVFSSLSSIDVIWAYLLGGIASMAATFYYFRGYPLSKPSRSMISEYVKFSRPLLIPSFIGMLPVSLSVVLVQLFWHLQVAGLFYASFRITSVFVILGGSVASVIFPRISELHSRGSGAMIKDSALKSEYFLSFVLAPVSAFLFVYPSGILHVIMSNKFLGASESLAILALWLYVSGIASPKNSVVGGMNRPGILGFISIAGTIISISVMIVAIPGSIFGFRLLGLGADGAAIALLAGAMLTYYLSHHHADRLAGTGFSWTIIVFMIEAAAAYALIYPLTFVLPLSLWAWYDLLLFAGLGGLVYVGISLATGFVGIEDIRVLIESFNPLAMGKYVSEELKSEFSDGRK